VSSSKIRGSQLPRASGASPCRPRRPEDTVLYFIVREDLETFLVHARQRYERALPRYVEKEFRDYIKCGIFSYGFLRCRCDTCGHDLLVAFSCKNRGICASCSARLWRRTFAVPQSDQGVTHVTVVQRKTEKS
jgi:ribosomal protein S27E